MVGRDSVVRLVEISYKTHSESFRRTTKRGAQDLSKELQEFADISNECT